MEMLENHSLSSVYPRVCGGTAPAPGSDTAAMGLSPRVRGNRGDASEALLPFGSIPACAGEPRPGKCATRRRGVYPRVCGGTPRAFPLAQSLSGLSPRVRGNLPE